MFRTLTKAINEEEDDFIYRILSDITRETTGPQLFNKDLLIRLLILKIYQPSKFKTIEGGHSNDTYLYEDEKLVLRLPKVQNPYNPELLIEIQNLHQAQSLNLTPLKAIAYYAKYNLLVTEFLPNYQIFSPIDFQNPAKIISLAHLVKKLHYSEFDFKKIQK